MSVYPDDGKSNPGDAATVEPDFLELDVARKEAVAQGTHLFELRRPDGQALPPFTAGSHLTVQVPNGVRRNYSLCGDPADTSVYQIAVKRDEHGRGGSVSMVDDVQVGQRLAVSVPRNNFELAESPGSPDAAGDLILIAGGIGITPILSMMRQLKRQGRGFRLYYCTRDPGTTAFREPIEADFPGQVQIHHDHGDLAQALDLWPVFETPTAAHVYCCGPRGLMDSVADMSGHWPSGSVHFESFGVDASTLAENKAFSVRLARAGQTVEVPAGQSILEALRGQGLHVPSSCESGTCGSCRTRLLAGVAEHRDMVLGEEERQDHIMVCVSRAVSPELLLDL